MSILILGIIYSIGVFRLKRWVLPVILFFTIGSSVASVRVFITKYYISAGEFLGLVIGLALTLTIACGAWAYRKEFSGPARKLWIQIPLLLVFAPVVMFSILTPIYTDDLGVYDSDILLPNMEILSEFDNAYYALPVIDELPLPLRDALIETDEYYRALEQGKSIGIDEVAPHLNALAGIIDAFIGASQKSGYQCPSSVNEYGPATILCSLEGFRAMAKAVALRSYVEAREGRIDIALDIALAPARFGKLMDSGHPDFIEHLVGIALTGISIDSIGRVLDQATPSESIPPNIARELEMYEFDGSSFVVFLKREYMERKKMLQMFEKLEGYSFHYANTLNDFAAIARRDIEAAGQRCGDRLEQNEAFFGVNVKEIKNSPIWLTALKPNGIGEILKQTIGDIPLGGSVRVKECAVNERNEKVQQRLLEKS
ncbi:MAG: hypothetical protein COZ49_01840 [Candidatus Yonathbacteria bacterium CG_4_10_14_3_um_filter_47_65]|uniref:Uncharacterized protein n=2 Tax=Parcubacteria group TaxID=1794811 RepID=A0A2M8D6S8_9BACT|nr:MAG: hypothetical protein AUJ44_03660 [Candidatus Nomurabacteria bacterium CG1_02_47_685]PIP03374.1 MAG: hypothetical protein COX54_03975 [Candidatus Yonathbacteria bacterium CG23_combo_of_CG06-09_8_20_14_all_46_18]PIQ32596.1 MAG: hypothetical protein COW61_01350 [Candidatus Yonathbacteria bacterium CG17_big_fil_post_rev_8_21_14_2_50_46_19]PIX56485.1 MAG: hypothetical protein COZ49_01840 [Candidatus Yonathbacteria bacterium CG_4_10_14_3_um_filter_47_65]PIY57273.1 MAG: hypothetical protein CO